MLLAQATQTSEEITQAVAAEAELVESARDGDTKAFAELYRANEAMIYGLCLRITANRAQAEELTQDVFVKIWHKLDKFRSESRFSTWAYRVAANHAISHQRKEGRWNLVELDEGHTPAANPGTGQKLDLDRAIAELPDGARTVLVLHEIGGFGHAEIGRMLDVAEGTCKAQLHRARKLLRAWFEVTTDGLSCDTITNSERSVVRSIDSDSKS